MSIVVLRPPYTSGQIVPAQKREMCGIGLKVSVDGVLTVTDPVAQQGVFSYDSSA